MKDGSAPDLQQACLARARGWDQLRETIQRKKSLRRWYEECYEKYRRCIEAAPSPGIALEIGSGGGFAKDVLPEIVTSDVIPYRGLDRVMSATELPYENESLKAILMLNVFHHISDVGAFLEEAQRCLVPEGRVLIIDQHWGFISAPILRYFHSEPSDPDTDDWKFESTDPLAAANGALAWMVFQRDREKFELSFPRLQLSRYEPHTPLRYWLAGGLKSWSLLPARGFGPATRLDQMLTRSFPNLGSFVDIEIRKPDDRG